MGGVGQVGANGQAVHAERANLACGFIRLIYRAAMMERDGISHAGKGQGKGFAKSAGGAGDEGEGKGHDRILHGNSGFNQVSRSRFICNRIFRTWKGLEKHKGIA